MELATASVYLQEADRATGSTYLWVLRICELCIIVCQQNKLLHNSLLLPPSLSQSLYSTKCKNIIRDWMSSVPFKAYTGKSNYPGHGKINWALLTITELDSVWRKRNPTWKKQNWRNSFRICSLNQNFFHSVYSLLLKSQMKSKRGQAKWNGQQSC